MAISTPPPAASPIDVASWTLSALQSLNISPIARGTGTPLAIPVDEPACVPTKRPPSCRDSQRRREELLRGKEGSRQRRRWENAHLVHVPNVQPPEPIDWEVRPTHAVHNVPYQLARFWDHGVRQQIEARASRLHAERKRQQRKAGSATGLGPGEVPRDLRDVAKRSPVVRDWVRSLELPVRSFLLEEHGMRMVDDDDDDDEEEEEIVFCGRKKGSSYRVARREVAQQVVDSGVVFDSFGDDESAAFKRWLAHAISDYYGLASRSVTLATQRVVYIGLDPKARVPLMPLPRPLWDLC